MANRQNESSRVEAHEAPRYEQWLGVTSSSFIPLLLTFVLPENFLMPMIAVAGVLLVAGLAMLARQGMHPAERHPE